LSATSGEGWSRVEQARDQLAAWLLGNPQVSMVDIGLAEGDELAVLRVHVRGADAPPDLPSEIDGIPVQVVPGDYVLE